MFQSFVIALREGVEAALIVGIVLGHLRKTGRESWRRVVYWGLAAALVASIVGAFLLSRMEINQEALEGWLRTVYATFGPQTDVTWRHLAETSWRRTDAGKITVHYDPRLMGHLTMHPEDWNHWAAYDRVQCKTLLLRGMASDVLSRETAEAMTRRGPHCRFVEIEYCGHAPMLNVLMEQQVVEEFLAS